MKKITLTLIVLMCIVTAFYDSKASKNNEEENVKIVKGIFAAFNAHDWQKMASFYAENAVLEDPSYEKPVIGNKDMPAKYAAMEAYFPDIYDHVQKIYPSENHVIVEFISTGTSKDGIKFSLPICTVLTIENGKVVRDATYYDLQN